MQNTVKQFQNSVHTSALLPESVFSYQRHASASWQSLEPFEGLPARAKNKISAPKILQRLFYLEENR